MHAFQYIFGSICNLIRIHGRQHIPGIFGRNSVIDIYCKVNGIGDSSVEVKDDIFYFTHSSCYCCRQAIGSWQNCFRLQLLQCLPSHTSSNWSIMAPMIFESFVTNPASKFRVSAPFIPSPAPVRFAEPE